MSRRVRRARKRLFVDIETSHIWARVWALNDPNNQHISHENIKREAEVICVAWKWAKKPKVECLTWDDRMSDKKMLQQFIPILESADEVIAHNGKKFDIKWLRGRCLIHRIPMSPKVPTVDTLLESRAKFRLASHRLDYLMKKAIGRGKAESGLSLWHDIEDFNCPKAMKKMVRYCKQDVQGLEEVWDWMSPYIEPKSNIAQFVGDCPECGSDRLGKHTERVTVSGTVNVQIRCYDCGRTRTISKSRYLAAKEIDPLGDMGE